MWHDSFSMYQHPFVDFIDESFLVVIVGGSFNVWPYRISLFRRQVRGDCGIMDEMTHYKIRSVDLFHCSLEPVRLWRFDIFTIVGSQKGFILLWYKTRRHTNLSLGNLLPSRTIIKFWVKRRLHKMCSRPRPCRSKFQNLPLFLVHLGQNIMPAIIISHGHEVLIRIQERHPICMRTETCPARCFGCILRRSLSRIVMCWSIIVAYFT
mmetsp:Transcript_10173/g.14907  ORF Transcript_10173/g.14907 Transcript_10173/m.14907 type:complete len:208 (-) Transcript_10173:139-762(-)